MRQVSFLLWIVLLVSLIGAQSSTLLPTSPAKGQGNSHRVIAKGVGAIIGGDLAKAEDEAIANALKNAIEQTVGTMIQSDVLVKNYQVLESNIYSRTREYIQSYRLLAKNEMGQNILEVTVEAVVKIEDLKKDLQALGLLFQQKNDPRLMVLVVEVNMHTRSPLIQLNLNTTETEIIQTLQSKGFQLVEKSVILKQIQQDTLQAVLEGDTATVRRIATVAGAEILIIGKAVYKAAGNVSAVLQNAGMTTSRATVYLRAIRGADGRVIATVTRQAVAAQLDSITSRIQALQKAAHSAALALAERIFEQWRQDVHSGSTLQVRVISIPSYGDLMHLKNWLVSNVRGIQKVSQSEFNGGTALLEVQTTQNSEKIAEEIILKGEKGGSDFQLDILEVTPNSLVVKYVKKKTPYPKKN